MYKTLKTNQLAANKAFTIVTQVKIKNTKLYYTALFITHSESLATYFSRAMFIYCTIQGLLPLFGQLPCGNVCRQTIKLPAFAANGVLLH